MSSNASQVQLLEQQMLAAARAQQRAQAQQLAQQLLSIAPDHPNALYLLGQDAARHGDAAQARHWFGRLVEVDGRAVEQWLALASACKLLGDDEGELRALTGALTLDPMDLAGLLLKANLFERQGNRHEAARLYGAAATVAPPAQRLAQNLRPAVAHAQQYRAQYDLEFGRFLDQFLAEHGRADGAAAGARFRDAVDILLGRKRRFDPQPSSLYYPRLEAREFWDDAEFPFLAELEAATADIREEMLRAMGAGESLVPYLDYPADAPLQQWKALNQSLDWGALHLLKDGVPVAANADRCPKTMAVLARAPQPDQPGRTPVAMFSVLKPRTRIPPHTGVSNVRLVVHLPLIVPPGCGFRVGNQTREWVPGKAWVFDDTIEHEAWNDSDETRVILIFDVWHPHLSAAERQSLTALSAGMNAFHAGKVEFGL